MSVEEPNFSSREYNLMIVDDDLGQVHLLQLLMAELGLDYRTHHAVNGTKALDFLHRRAPYEQAPRPNLILLDLNMPGMNGHEVLRKIKSDSSLRTIPVIVLSNSRNSKDVDDCYREHANAYIPKPADLESNLNLLREIDRFWGQIVQLPPL